MRRAISLVGSILALVALGCGGGGDSEPAGRTGGDGPRPEAELKSVDPAQTGALSGTLRFDGEAPQAAPLELRADAWCRNHYETPPKDESLVVRDGKLANAFVYLSAGLEDYRFDPPTDKRLLDQNGCIFGPRVIGVRVGQPITMANSDPVLHNVHTKPERNRGRNIALPAKGSKRDFTFDKPEVMIPVVCDVHPWMRAFIGVVEHPYFAVTTSDGSYRIEGVPAGDYTLSIWHEALGTREVAVTVASGTETAVEDVHFQLP